MTVPVPLTVDLPESTLALLEAAAPLVRAIRSQAPALRVLGTAGRDFAREASRIVKEERRKRAPGRPRPRVR